MIRTIRLYGRLKTKFGPVFRLDSDSPADVIRALCTIVPGFETELAKGQYRFYRGNRQTGLQMNEDLLHVGLGNTRELHLLPTRAAAKSGGIGKILLGAVMIGTAFATGGLALAPAGFGGAGMFGTSLLVGTGLAGMAGTLGITMMLGGLSSILTPKPKATSVSQDQKDSFLFSGATNTATQGVSVPIIYGRIVAGSVVVSAGLDAEEVGAYNGVTAGTAHSTSGVLWSPVHDLIAAKGGKGGSSSSTSGQEAPNTLQSDSTARILDLVSEGPIIGLADTASPLKSVYFDDVVVQNSDGSFNFKGVTIDQRLGNPSDDPISGFSDTESEVSVSVKCLVGTPLVRSINDTNVNEVRVTVQVPALFSVGDDGSISGTTVQFAFDIQPNGGSYSEVLNTTINGKTNTTYQRAFRLPLTGTGPWNIRLRRITADSASSKLQNDIYWSSYTEIVDARLMYPNSALIGIIADARQFGSSIPNRSYDIKGRVLNVPANYDPDTRTYATTGTGTSGGVWDGTFKQAWSDNPAWVLYDILTNNRYGLGDDILSTLPNKWSLYEIAQYCDQLVPDGAGGTEPRYTINTQIVDRGEAWALLASIVSVFRGMYYWGSNSVEFSYDHDSTPVKLVTKANVVDGKFSYSTDNYRARHSVVIVSWNDPAIGGKVNYEVVQDPDLLAKYGSKQVETTAWGCTSRGQANRVGKWMLETEKYGELVTYTAGLDHSDLRPGQIVEVNDPEYTSTRMAGRLVAGSTTTRLQLDGAIDFTGITSGATIRAMLPDGTVEQRTIDFSVSGTTASGNTTSIAVTAAFSQVPLVDAMWSVSCDAVEARLFQVIGVEESDPMTFTVTAMWFDPNKFARVEQDLDLPPNTFSNIPTGALVPPSSVDLKDFLFREGDATMPGAMISWPVSTDPRVTYYQWQVKSLVDDWGQFFDTTRLSDELRNIKGGTYAARVRSCNYLGSKSAWREVDGITLIGGDATLPDVTGLTVVRNDAALNSVLKWDAAPDTEARPIEFEVLYHATSTAIADAVSLGRTQLRERVINQAGNFWVRSAFGLNVDSTAAYLAVADSDLPSIAEALSGYLTNEAQVLPADSAGNVLSYDGASGNFKVFLGTTDVTTGCTFASGATSGGFGTATLDNATGAYAVTNVVATQDKFWWDIVATHTSSGATITKRFSLTKSKAGVDGTDGVSPPLVTLTASGQIFQYDQNGDLVANTITFSAARQNGDSALVSWAMYDATGASLGSYTDATALAATTYFTRVDDSTVTMSNTQFASFTDYGGLANRETFTLVATYDGLSDKVTINTLRDTVASEITDNMDYKSATAFERRWSKAGSGESAIVTSDSRGGYAVQIGNNSGDDDLYGVFDTWLDYSPEDLYEAWFDIEIIASDATATFYAGVQATDRLGNNLGQSYNYVAASGINQAASIGRQTWHGYFRGTAAVASSGQSNDIANPVPLPDGTATDGAGAPYGDGPSVRVRPVFIFNYPHGSGEVILHGVGLRKVVDATVIWTGPWSSSKTYHLNDGVTYQGRSFAAKVGNTNQTPPATATSNSYWYLVADKGASTGTFTLTTNDATRFVWSGSSVDATGSTGWGNLGAYSPQSYGAGVAVSYNPLDTHGQPEAYMIGLNTDAAATENYSDIDYALFHAYNGSSYEVQIYENGTQVASGFTWSAAWQYSIRYDGLYVTYSYTNAGSTTIMREVWVGPNKQFALDIAVNSSCSLSNLAFGAGGSDGLNGGSFTPILSSGMARNANGGFTKTSLTSGWDEQVYSSEKIQGARVSFRSLQTNSEQMVGLNTDPTTDANYTSIDNAIYCHESGNLYLYENGTGTSAITTYTATDILSVEQRGDLVFYCKNGTPFYVSHTAQSAPMAMDSSFVGNSAGTAGIADVIFGTAPAAPDLFQFDVQTLTQSGTTWSKSGGSNGVWDSGFMSSKGYSGAEISAAVHETTSHIMLGLSIQRPTSKDYTAIDCAAYLDAGSLLVYQDGTSKGVDLGAYAVGDVITVRHQQSEVHVLKNGDLLYRFTGVYWIVPNQQFYAHSSFLETGATLDGVTFGQSAVNGTRPDIKFLRSGSAPTTPTGDDPSGWSDGVPSGNDPLWVIRATKNYGGNVLGTWSTPELISGQIAPVPYASGSTYYEFQTVTYNGGTYICAVSSTTGNAPSGDANANTWWDVIAAPGAPGTPGTAPSGFTTTITLSSLTGLTNLRTIADANGYPGGDATVTFVVPNGVTLRGTGASSGSAGGNAVDTGVWSSSTYSIALTLQVNSGGIVDGGGGGGGAGGGHSSPGVGGVGGDAVYCREGLTVSNSGTIRGGGNGGSGGASARTTVNGDPAVVPGGGGGGGFPNGSGGVAGSGDVGTATAGSAGTTSGGGGGGSGGTFGSVSGSAGSSGSGAGANGYAIRHNGNTVSYSGAGTLTGTNA